MFNLKCFFGWHKFQLIEEKYTVPQILSYKDREYVLNTRGIKEYIFMISGFTEKIHQCSSCEKYKYTSYKGDERSVKQ